MEGAQDKREKEKELKGPGKRERRDRNRGGQREREGVAPWDVKWDDLACWDRRSQVG